MVDDVNVTIIPTFRCQLAPNHNKRGCIYCDYRPSRDGKRVLLFNRRTLDVKRELTPQEWIGFLGKLASATIDFTGGEPLMYRDFPTLIKWLPYHIKWAVTSNTLNTKAIERLYPFKCIGWQASYHPFAKKDDTFIQNMKTLIKRGFPVRISIVGYPDYLDSLPEMINKFKGLAKVSILPFYTMDWDWRKEPELMAKLMKLRPFYDENDRLYWDWEAKPQYCSAGSDYITIMPDGDVWRCYTAFILGAESHYMGNILDGFKLNSNKEFCDLPCSFPCDWSRCTKEENVCQGTV